MVRKECAVLVLLGLCLLEFTTACQQENITDCATAAHIDDLDDFPVLLNVAEADLDSFCANIIEFGACLDAFRTDCTFDLWKLYSSYEEQGKFICNSEESRNNYIEHNETISNTTYRDEWEQCVDDFDLSEKEEAAEACVKLDDQVECHTNVISSSETTATTDYIKEFATASLADYNTHYRCADSSAPGLKVTCSVIIMSLLSLAWAI